MKIYISGPMTGYPELNFPNFHRVAAQLREEGHDVVNPAEINPDPKADWLDCIAEDLRAMRGCDAIFMLNEHSTSYGAGIEYLCALKLGLDVIYESE